MSLEDKKALIVDGALYIVMPSIWASDCTGCHFSLADPCPHQRKLVYCGDPDDDADHILIHDNPQAIADYVALRLDKT
jgi:hypothetical protein